MFTYVVASVIAINGTSNHMATGRINKSAVDRQIPKDRDHFLWDDKVTGFGLKITPAGNKVYLFQYRIGGRGAKVRRYTIGRHGTLTPEGARKEAERLALMVSQQLDPQDEKVERQRKSIDLAFPVYLENFAKNCLAERWKGSATEVEAMLRSHALPSLRSNTLPEIRRADVAAIIRQVSDRPALASKLFAILRYLFRHAVSEGDLNQSPLDGMKPPPLPASRDRVLNDRELALVWRGSQELGYPFGSFIRLLIVTGARRKEIAGLTWSELDRDKLIWSIPAERSKNGLSAHLPLSTIAITELDALSGCTGEQIAWPRNGLVLTTTGNTPVSGYSRAKTRLDTWIQRAESENLDPIFFPPWRLHDLRRTVATGLQKLGVRFEVTEAILNHVGSSKSGVAGIYQRHDWATEKRAALEAWAGHIKTNIATTRIDNLGI